VTTPRLLDLFCGAGGAARGYQLAGFHVTGVDIKPQPRYIGDEFHQADALTFPLDGFDAIHASPPCQAFSKAVMIKNRGNHPDLVATTRERLRGRVYVMENVPAAPLVDAITLCGSGFGLPIQRHRIFESSVFLMAVPCAHRAYPAIYPPARNRTNPLRVLSVSSGYQEAKHLGPGYMDMHRAAMGIDWMLRDELTQAIPPAYTEWIGRQLLRALELAAAS
jgi:site-specific DNA-cytosine methylase